MKRFSTLVVALAAIALVQPSPVAAQSLNDDVLANLAYRELGPTRQAAHGNPALLQTR